MASYWLISLALIVDGLAGFAGALLSERWLGRRQQGFMAFAAGALLTAVFLDILPEAVERFGSSSLLWAFVSFVGMAFLESALGHHHVRGEAGESVPLPGALLASDAAHNIGDGAAVAAAFLVSPQVGVVTALAVIAHEVPQEVGDYVLLRAAGYSKARALLANAAIQLTAVVGALGVLFAARMIARATGVILALAAGSFLYIGATDLLPEISVRRGRQWDRWLGFAGGVTLVALASLLEPS